MSSFDNPKELRFVITLGTGTFGSSNANTITLQGYRAVVDIDKAGGQVMGTLRAQIFGVSQSDMNSVVTVRGQQVLGQAGTQGVTSGSFTPSTVTVTAIDGATETLIFTGNIVNAWGNYQNMPDVFLMIQAQAVFYHQLNPVAPTSYKGGIDVVTAMQQLAGKMGLTFENNGVSGNLLANQYLPNTYVEQAKALARAAGIWMYIDNGVLAIAPAGQSRSGTIPLVSSTTGMIGYPTFDGVGVNFQMFFNPAVRFGGSIQTQSDIRQATGTWIVTSVALRLESEKPHGAWFMTVRGTISGLAVVSA